MIWVIFTHICIADGEDGVLYEHPDYQHYTLVENHNGVCQAFLQELFSGTYITKDLQNEIDNIHGQGTFNFLYRYKTPQEVINTINLDIPIIFADRHFIEDIVLIERPTKFIISAKNPDLIYPILYDKYYNAIIRADLGVKEVWSGNQLTLTAAIQHIVKDQERRFNNDVERIEKCGERYRLSLYRYVDDISFLDSIDILRIPYLENKFHQ